LPETKKKLFFTWKIKIELFSLMGVGPSKIIERLYVGSIRDATDKKKLNDNKITHILSLLSQKQISDQKRSESSSHNKKFTESVGSEKYKRYRVILEDKPDSELSKHFRSTSGFIHESLYGENGTVLVHCMMGKSRSVTVLIAYLCTLTGLSWLEVLNAVRQCRGVAEPNSGFKEQLRLYEEAGSFKSDWNFLEGCTCRVSTPEIDKIKRRLSHLSQQYLEESRAKSEKLRQREKILYTQ